MLNLTRDNYHSLEANREYMSNTQRKNYMECEAKTQAILDDTWKEEVEEKEKIGLVQGKYMHAWNEGTLPEFREKNPDIFTTASINTILYKLSPDQENELSTKYAKLFTCNEKYKGTKPQLIDAIKKLGFNIPVMKLKAEFQSCDNAIKILEDDPFMMDMLRGEKEVIFTAEMYGCTWKTMIDSLHLGPESFFHDRFADLKYLKDLTSKFWKQEEDLPGYYQNIFEKFEYFTQMAIYAKGIQIATNRDNMPEPHLVVITKEKYPEKAVIEFSGTETRHEDELKIILAREVEPYMERINDVKAGRSKPTRCEKCDYCRSTKKLKGTTHFSQYSLYGGI